MKFSIVTLFPESFDSYFGSSMIKRAKEAGLIFVDFYNPRDYAMGTHKKVDDRPYGGGPGMVMYAQPILDAVKAAKPGKKSKVIILSPGGTEFTNTLATTWKKKYDHLILIAGHYEGIDARVKKILKAEEVTIGPYILTGGEVPAMVIVDAVSRQIKGVLGDEDSLEENRISSSEVYTRPEILEYQEKKYKVPKVLLSGNHKDIEEWKVSRKKV